MQIPGCHIATLGNPALYSAAQIDRAAAIAYVLNRGQFVLVEAPKR
jgi:hypothetical protein